MKGKYTYRIINTVITAIGTLLCIVSGFIPAPYGLLSDGTISLIQSLPGSQKAVSFLLPVLLFIAATVIVGAGRYRLGSLITVLAGSCIFALMDLSYIKASMAFTGTLLNELGIVTTLSGVLLHAIGTPKSERPKNESLMKTLDSFLEAELAPEPEPVSEPDVEPEPDGEPKTEPKAAETAVQASLSEKIAGTDEQQERDTPAEITQVDDPMTYTQVLQPADAESEELTEEAGNPMTYTQVLQPADAEHELPVKEIEPTEDIKAYTQVLQPFEPESEEQIAEYSEMTIEAAPEAASEAEPLEHTIILDAYVEDLLINADRQEN